MASHGQDKIDLCRLWQCCNIHHSICWKSQKQQWTNGIDKIQKVRLDYYLTKNFPFNIFLTQTLT